MNDTPCVPRRGRAALRAVLLLALATSGACVPVVKGIGLREASVDMPETFGDAAPTEVDLEILRQDEVFADPNLVALIEDALAHNQELEILRQDINIENAEIIARRGEVFPRLGLGVDAGVEKVGRYTSQGAADASTDIEPGREVPEHLGDFRIALHASWEIDIWKKLRNATKAARARYLSSIEGRAFAVTGLVAEITNSYYELIALDRELDVLASNIEILRKALEIVRLQQQAAHVTSLAVQRFEAELLEFEGRRFEVQQRIVEAENRINFLAGRYPQSVPRSTAFLERQLSPMSAGLPAQLLTRRPDIRAAELDLEAAKLDVKVARARFFPSLEIDARFGIEAFNPTKFIALPASLLYDVAAHLLEPLLNRSEIKADYYAANARQMQAVVGYERTALLAFVDVANQLAAIDNFDQAFQRKSDQVALLQQAIETSNRLFRAAHADYLEVLTTRREALDAELELIETRRRQLAARIDLYRALGGGWPGADAVTDASATPTNAEGD